MIRREAVASDRTCFEEMFQEHAVFISLIKESIEFSLFARLFSIETDDNQFKEMTPNFLPYLNSKPPNLANHRGNGLLGISFGVFFSWGALSLLKLLKIVSLYSILFYLPYFMFLFILFTVLLLLRFLNSELLKVISYKEGPHFSI